jgi:cytochrome c-type biogenesis protein CcmH/NrfG
MSKTASKNNSFGGNNADRVVLGLIALCLVAFAIHHIIAYDLWWQLKTGQLIRQSGLPATDPFSYAFANGVWIECHWLYCVIISFIYDGLGIDYLIVAKVLMLLLAGFCLWRFGRDDARWAVNLGLLSALILIHQRMMVRPELVTFVLLPVYFLLLRRFQTTRKLHWLIPLPLLQILWANSHPLFILGLVIVWIFALSQIVDKTLGRVPGGEERDESAKWLLFAAIAVTLACLVNPYGVSGAFFPFELFREMQSDTGLGNLLPELRSTFSSPAISLLFVSYGGVILISAFGFVIRRRTVPLGWFAVWCAFLYLSTVAHRNIALFGIAAGASIIINFGDLPVGRRVVWCARAVCAGFVLVMLPLIVTNYYYRAVEPDRKFGFGVAERRFPIKAMEFVETQNLPQPVITNLNESAYPLFKEGPRSVFVDGRLEIYGASNIVASAKTFSNGEGLLDLVTRLNVFTLIAHIDNDAILVQRLMGDPAWGAVYFDDSHIVFVRNAPVTQAIVQRFKINWLDPQPMKVNGPAQFREDHFLTGVFPSVGDSGPARSLARLYLLGQNYPLAQASYEEAMRRWPDDPQVCFPLGVMYRAQKREADAKKLLASVPKETFNTHNNQVFAGMIYEANSNWAAATDAWLQVANLGDKSYAVYQHLAQAATNGEKWDAALIAFDAMSKTTPNDVETLNNLGAVAERLDKRQEAITALSRSLQLKPAQADVATQLGLIKVKMGDNEGAKQAFEQALQADPSFDPPKRYLEKLRAANAVK